MQGVVHGNWDGSKVEEAWAMEDLGNVEEREKVMVPPKHLVHASTNTAVQVSESECLSSCMRLCVFVCGMCTDPWQRSKCRTWTW